MVAVLIAAANSACDKEGFDYDISGGQQSSNYIIADTLTISQQTIRLDSVPTSGLGVMLCGKQTDPYFGKITAGSFFQLALPTNKTLDETSTYDYVELVLYTNRKLYGDSTLSQHINVYEVQQTIEKNTNSAYIYSHNDFQTSSTPLGSLQQVIRPNFDTVVKIRLADTYGATLFKLFKDQSTLISTQDIFLNYYKGLAIKPGDNSGNILGFNTSDTSVILRMHYHNKEPFFTDRHLDLNVYNENVQFNQVSVDRSGTLLSALSPGNKSLPTAQTSNLSFIQPLTGVATRIDLPTLKNLASVGSFFKVMRASLTIQPVAGTYDPPYALPPHLTICEVDKQNNVTDTLVSSLGAVMYGNLFIDNLYQEKTNYTYDITHYCINEINSTDAFSRGILIIPPRSASLTGFNRVVLGDSQRKQNKISVQVVYLRYN
jgi:hypothetical protein